MNSIAKVLAGITFALSINACSSADTEIFRAFNEGRDVDFDVLRGGLELDTSAISGVWDWTLNEGGLQDVQVWEIGTRGELTIFDDLSDAAAAADDDLRNCINILQTIVIPNGNNEYTIRNFGGVGEGDGDKMTVVRSGNTLTVSGDGEPAIVYPAFTGTTANFRENRCGSGL